MYDVDVSYQLATICLIWFVVMLIISKPIRTLINPCNNNRYKKASFLFFLYILNSVFAFWAADTYHYWTTFIMSHYSSDVLISSEVFYNWLAEKVNYNYFAWRACIWIPACLFIYLTAKRLNLLFGNFWVALILFGGLLAYTRGMLGHTMLLFGVVLWIDSNNSRSTRLIGLLFFCMSYFFHKSMVVNMLFALLAFYPSDKKVYLFSLIFFPFGSFLASKLIAGMVSGNIDLAVGEGMGNTATVYAAGEKSVANIYGIIGKFITIIPEYLTLFYLVNRILYKNYFKGIKQERIFTYLFRLTYVAIYVASLFYFVETSSWIYERFKYMAFFPLPFVLAKVWSLESRSNLWIQLIIVLQLFSLIFSWFMKIYSWYGL